jgi:hypothetical protein
MLCVENCHDRPSLANFLPNKGVVNIAEQQEVYPYSM